MAFTCIVIEIPTRELFVYQNIPPRWETNPIQLLVKTLLHTLKYLWNGIKRCQKIQEFAERLSWTGFLQQTTEPAFVRVMLYDNDLRRLYRSAHATLQDL